MRNKTHNSIVDVIEKAIEKKINDKQSYSWRELKIRKFYLILNAINCLIICIREALSLGWETKIHPEFDEEENHQLIKQFYSLGDKEFFEQVDVSLVYQMLLSDDLLRVNDRYLFVVDKHQRDNLGSYYTPNWLSYDLTLKIINQYFFSKSGSEISGISNKEKLFNIFKELKVADLSVGGGTFIIAYIDIIKKYVTENGKQINEILNSVYGIDVDPIALLISKHEISKKIGEDSSNVNLILGNPLINDVGTLEEKFNDISEGRIYKKSMGVAKKLYKQKFDIIIGNPPWEKIRFEEKSFFNQYYPQISNISKKDERQAAIDNLIKTSKENYIYYKNFFDDYSEIKKILKKNSLLKYSLSGEVNTYSLFYELSFNLLSEDGVLGLLVKSSMVKTTSNKKLFNFLVSNRYLSEINLLKNTKKIFEIDSREEFAFVSSSKKQKEFFRVQTNISTQTEFNNNTKKIFLNDELLSKFDPISKMLPNITDNREIQFLTNMHENNRFFSEVFPNVIFGRLVHFTNHSKYIKKSLKSNLPIYEGKFIERYDSMFATFKNMNERDRYKSKATAFIQGSGNKEIPESRFFIDENFWEIISRKYDEKFTIMWRSLTSNSNKRTMLATIMPFVPTSQSIQFLQAESNKESLIILSIFNSIIFDYFVRLKMPGIDLTQSVIKIIPVPEKSCFDTKIEFMGVNTSFYEHIISRISWLYRNDSRVFELFENNKLIYDGENEKKCNAELDILIGMLYKIPKREIKNIAMKFSLYYSEEEVNLFF